MATSKALATTKRSPARTAPAVIEQAALVITGVPTVEQVKQVLSEGSKFFIDEESVSNTGSFLTSVLDRATSASDLFAESELLNMKEHLGEVFVLEGIDAVRPSDYDEEGGLGVYLIVSAVDS